MFNIGDKLQHKRLGTEAVIIDIRKDVYRLKTRDNYYDHYKKYVDQDWTLVASAASAQAAPAPAPSPRFKVGDRVQGCLSGKFATIDSIDGNGWYHGHYDDGSVLRCDGHFLKLVASARTASAPTAEQLDNEYKNIVASVSDTEPACLCRTPSAHDEACAWVRWREERRRA